jgi:hypothetical protein
MLQREVASSKFVKILQFSSAWQAPFDGGTIVEFAQFFQIEAGSRDAAQHGRFGAERGGDLARIGPDQLASATKTVFSIAGRSGHGHCLPFMRMPRVGVDGILSCDSIERAILMGRIHPDKIALGCLRPAGENPLLRGASARKGNPAQRFDGRYRLPQ